MITFEPVIVVKDGKFIVENLKQIKYSTDNVLELLREGGIFNVEEVQLGVIEANGRLSIYKKPEKSPVTPEDLNIPKQKSSIAYPVIIEGRIYNKMLNDLKLSETWLYEQLKQQNTKIDEIFFASIDEQKQLQISTKHGFPD